MLELDRQARINVNGVYLKRFWYKCACGYERLYAKKTPSGVSRKCPTCDAHTMTCLVCGNVFTKPDNASLHNFKKRKGCSRKCSALYAKATKDGEDFDPSLLPRNANIKKITVAKNDIQRKPHKQDEIICCANCEWFDTQSCPTKEIVFVAKKFDVFKFRCDKFNKSGGYDGNTDK